MSDTMCAGCTQILDPADPDVLSLNDGTPWHIRCFSRARANFRPDPEERMAEFHHISRDELVAIAEAIIRECGQ